MVTERKVLLSKLFYKTIHVKRVSIFPFVSPPALLVWIKYKKNCTQILFNPFDNEEITFGQ